MQINKFCYPQGYDTKLIHKEDIVEEGSDARRKGQCVEGPL